MGAAVSEPFESKRKPTMILTSAAPKMRKFFFPKVRTSSCCKGFRCSFCCSSSFFFFFFLPIFIPPIQSSGITGGHRALCAPSAYFLRSFTISPFFMVKNGTLPSNTPRGFTTPEAPANGSISLISCARLFASFAPESIALSKRIPAS